MLLKSLTDSQLRGTFEQILANIRAAKIRGCPSDTGLDDETAAALDGVAAGTVTPEQARAEFARMLDGTHARQVRQRIERNNHGQS